MVAQPDIGSKFDLTLYVYESDDRFNLLLVYNSALYRADTMRALARPVRPAGRRRSSADPTQPISSYSLVTPERPSGAAGRVGAARRHVARIGAGRGAAGGGPHARSTQLSSIRSVTWSYRSLEHHMDRLAAWLGERGVGKGDLVAIYGHRSASLVVRGDRRTRVRGGVPAARPEVSSGAARQDPAHRPPQRLARGCRRRTTDRRARQRARRARRRCAATIPPLDVLDSSAADESAPDTAALQAITDDIGPDDFACLTFTSGSTGEPKAIIGRHGSLTHFLPWQSERFDIGAAGPLLDAVRTRPRSDPAGHVLAALGRRNDRGPRSRRDRHARLARRLAARPRAITVAHLTPAMGQLIADGSLTGGRHQPVPSLRNAFFIGDSLSRRDVAQFQALAPNVQVVNLYGATETQRASGHHVVDADRGTLERPRPRRLARCYRSASAFPDTQLLVRGADRQSRRDRRDRRDLVPQPAPRRSAISIDQTRRPTGSSQRRWRSDRPLLPNRRSRSIPPQRRGRVPRSPRRPGQGPRFPRRARRGPRSDRRPATRPRRRRPDRSRARLGPADRLRRARRATGSTRRACADAPCATGCPATWCRRDFVVIPRIPLTPNGKLDAPRCPSPAAAIREISSVEPRDQLERSLVGWWGEVLGRSDIGIHDDFFDLGGYSLLATRLFALIEANTGRRIPVSTLFEAPTIAELASVLRGDDAPAPWSSLVPVQPKGIADPVLLRRSVHDQRASVRPPRRRARRRPTAVRAAAPRPRRRACRSTSGSRTWPPTTSTSSATSSRWARTASVVTVRARGWPSRWPASWRRQVNGSTRWCWSTRGHPTLTASRSSRCSYILGRLRFYFRDGRLRHAMAWQARIIVNALLLRRVGTKTVKFTEEVKASPPRRLPGCTRAG